MDLMRQNLWLPKLRQDDEVQLRLFCFPYAGGGAGVFREWAQKLPPHIEVCPVQLPGREFRLRELPYTRLSLLVKAIHQSLSSLYDQPFVFFGHSMGALIAFELARQLQSQERQNFRHLFVGGHRAPQVPDRDPPLHGLPNEVFIQRLRNYSGTPDMVLEHPDFTKVFLPLLRADFAVCETYRYAEQRELLGCPMTVFGGIQDQDVTKDDLLAWQGLTTGSFKQVMLPGNHFFLHASLSALLEIVMEDITNYLSDSYIHHSLKLADTVVG